MTRFIIRRLLWMIPTVLIVTFVVYIALRIGRDPVESYKRANARASAKKLQEYRDINGLWDGPGGYVRGYFHWLKGFVTFDWPRSIKGRKEVWPLLKDAMANTLRLGIVASIIGMIVGNSLGVLAAKKPGGKVDSFVNGTALVGIAVPPFVTALVLQLVFAVQWSKWFGKPLLPAAGIYPPGQRGFSLSLMAKHMVMPVIVVSIQTIAQYSRYMRASLLDVLNSDYMRTARAKGISEGRVLVRHAIRNALGPVTTLYLLELGALLGGLIITEGLFEYPGMGRYFLGAFVEGDFPMLMPWMVIFVISVVSFNLLADLANSWLDPRVRLN